MRAMTNEIREKIKTYRRNGMDISELIGDVIIAGEDLSGTIISKFSRRERDLRSIDFSNCILGDKSVITNICDKDFRNCNFTKTTMLGVVFARRCDFRGSNFQSATVTDMQYQNSDLRNCNFCETAVRWGISYGLGAKIDENIFQDLAKAWNLKVTVGASNDK